MELTAPRRSQLLQQLLQQQVQPQPNIRSGGELLAKLLAQGVRQAQINRMQEQEAQAESDSNRRIADVLAGQQGRQLLDLQNIEGGVDTISVPQKRGAEGLQRQHTLESALNPQEMQAYQTLRQSQRALADPTEFQQRQILQDDAQAAITAESEADRDFRSTEAGLDRDFRSTEAGLNRELTKDQNQRNREANARLQELRLLHDEDAQIRDIQSKAALERIKNEAKGAGYDLTERQGKATSWLNQMETGIGLIEQQFEAGFEINEKDIIAYSKAIDDETGAINRRILRNAMSQDAINFFDAAYAVIDPVVRQSTGAAVKPFEFHNWFNTLIPMSNDRGEKEQKQFMRNRLSAGIAIEAGPGIELVRQIHSAIPQPGLQYVTINGKQYEVGQEVTGEGGRKGTVNADGTITPIG